MPTRIIIVVIFGVSWAHFRTPGFSPARRAKLEEAGLHPVDPWWMAGSWILGISMDKYNGMRIILCRTLKRSLPHVLYSQPTFTQLHIRVHSTSHSHTFSIEDERRERCVKVSRPAGVGRLGRLESTPQKS